MDMEHARYNMIEQQIRTWSVLDQDILDLLSIVHREDFVPPAYRTMAFTDMEIPLTVGGRVTGETMLAPKVEARILQELAVRKHESVLEIGTGSGHMAALLAHRARHVDTLGRCQARQQAVFGEIWCSGDANQPRDAFRTGACQKQSQPARLP